MSRSVLSMIYGLVNAYARSDMEAVRQYSNLINEDFRSIRETMMFIAFNDLIDLMRYTIRTNTLLYDRTSICSSIKLSQGSMKNLLDETLDMIDDTVSIEETY